MSPQNQGDVGMIQVDVAESVRRRWGWILALGALLIAFGVVAIAMPVAAGQVASVVIGAMLVVAGAFQGWSALGCEGWRGRVWHALSGAIYVVGGLLLITQPLVGTMALSLLIVAILIVDGAARIMLGWRMRPERGWGWLAASGALSLLLGLWVMLFALPAASLVLLGAVLGVSLIFEGASFIYLGFAARPADDRA